MKDLDSYREVGGTCCCTLGSSIARRLAETCRGQGLGFGVEG